MPFQFASKLVFRGARTRRHPSLARRILKRLVAPASDAVIDFDGFTLSLPKSGSSIQEYIAGEYEPFTTSIFYDRIRPGQIVLDVGAQVGYFSIVAATLVGNDGRVYAIEPEPGNVRYLCKNIAENDLTSRVTVVPKAVGDTPATLELFLYQGSDSHSFVRHPTAQVRDIAKIECVCLDAELPLTHFDFLKLDVEGFELNVLRGMTKLLERSQDATLVVEMVPAFLKNAGTSASELRDYLCGLGWRVRVIDEQRRTLTELSESFMSSTDPKVYANLLCEPQVRNAS